jgi:hypothetical protein
MKIDERTAEMRRQGDKERGRQGDKETKCFPPCLLVSPSPCLPVPLSLCLLLFLSFCLAGCKPPNPEVEKRAAVDEFFARVKSCWPSNESEGEDSGSLKLAVEPIESAPNATRVRLVAYARDEAVDFYLPLYRMSAGRWLINEKGRVYLLDEQCREIKLNDAKPSPGSSSDFLGGRKIPPDGRIRLKPGEAFEMTLDFPPLKDRTRVGALVYDGRVLPFASRAETDE